MHYSIAIDGPAGAGKSTIARRLAELLQVSYVETGAIYRAVGYEICRRGIAPEDHEAVTQVLPELEPELRWTEEGIQHVFLSGTDVTAHLRSAEVSEIASIISTIPAVRVFLLDTQRAVARTHSVVMDGRDIGTVVLPNADVKIFLSASAQVRAKRRWLEMQADGRPDTYEEVLRVVNERDFRDSNRAIAPLRPADDAVLLDTSELTLEQSVDAILNIVRGKLEV